MTYLDEDKKFHCRYCKTEFTGLINHAARHIKTKQHLQLQSLTKQIEDGVRITKKIYQYSKAAYKNTEIIKKKSFS